MPGKVFGVELETLSANQKVEIPKIVVHVFEYLHSKKAHLEEGIFRIPGNNQRIGQLKKQFDTDGHVDLFKQKDLEIHTVAGILKLFLRELPVPIIIPRYYSTFLKVYQNPDARQRMINFRKLVAGLPKANRLLLLSVLSYLHVVADNCKVNKMSTLNLALIFAPNVMKAEKETLHQIMADSDKVAGTLQLLIQEIDYLKSGNEPSWFAELAKPLPRSKSFSSPPVPKPNFDEKHTDENSISSSPVSDSECSASTSPGSFDPISIQIDVFCTSSLPNPTLESYGSTKSPELKRRSVNRSNSFSPQSELVNPSLPAINEGTPQTESTSEHHQHENPEHTEPPESSEPSSSSPPDPSLLSDMKPLPPDLLDNPLDFNSKKLMRHSTVVPRIAEPQSPRRRPETLVRTRSETALANAWTTQTQGPALTKEECKYKLDQSQRLAERSERERKRRSQQIAVNNNNDNNNNNTTEVATNGISGSA